MLFRLGRLFRTLGRDIVVLWYAARHPATPLLMKLGILLLALYVISPLDFIPDWLALFGLVDDVGLIALGIPLLFNLLPEPVLRDARVAAESRLSRPKFWQHK